MNGTPHKKRLMVELEEEKHKELKMLCAYHDRSICNVVNEGVEIMLEKLRLKDKQK